MRHVLWMYSTDLRTARSRGLSQLCGALPAPIPHPPPNICGKHPHPHTSLRHEVQRGGSPSAAHTSLDAALLHMPLPTC